MTAIHIHAICALTCLAYCLHTCGAAPKCLIPPAEPPSKPPPPRHTYVIVANHCRHYAAVPDPVGKYTCPAGLVYWMCPYSTPFVCPVNETLFMEFFDAEQPCGRNPGCYCPPGHWYDGVHCHEEPCSPAPPPVEHWPQPSCPDAVCPVVFCPDVVCPDVVCPDKVCPDAVCPDAVCPDVVCPDAVCPDVVCPDKVCPDAVCPDVVCPDKVCPDAVCPDVVCAPPPACPTPASPPTCPTPPSQPACTTPPKPSDATCHIAPAVFTAAEVDYYLNHFDHVDVYEGKEYLPLCEAVEQAALFLYRELVNYRFVRYTKTKGVATPTLYRYQKTELTGIWVGVDVCAVKADDLVRMADHQLN